MGIGRVVWCVQYSAALNIQCAFFVAGIVVTVTGTPYTVLGSFSTIFTCCVFSVFTYRSIRIVEVLQIRA